MPTSKLQVRSLSFAKARQSSLGRGFWQPGSSRFSHRPLQVNACLRSRSRRLQTHPSRSHHGPSIATIKQGNDRGRAPRKTEDRSPARSRSPSPSDRPRAASSSGFKPKGKFIWRGGCNHCNAPDHQNKIARHSSRSKRNMMANSPTATQEPARSPMRNGATIKRPEQRKGRTKSRPLQLLPQTMPMTIATSQSRTFQQPAFAPL